MNFSKNRKLIRYILTGVSFIIVATILWNTYDFFQKFKEEERIKMEIIAIAQKKMAENPLDGEHVEFLRKILNSNNSIPMILVNKDGNLLSRNLNSSREIDSLYLAKQLEIMKNNNKPIDATYLESEEGRKKVYAKQTIYYRNSDLLTKLKYYPLALLLILALFGSVIYLVIKSTKVAEKNKLWAGMAKETAHQIGTPLSSLLGWVEILRMDKVEESTVKEIEKDIDRLNTIADRFSKIGSIPVLKSLNLVEETKKSYDYLVSRSSKKIDFNFTTSTNNIPVKANRQLFSWVIENLIKNAIDAMQGKGKLHLEIFTNGKYAKIWITDSGKGIPRADFKKVFETGFTTKKRGWGLGLSLSKRIIEDYHNGRIYVKSATLNKGTCMAISIKIIT